MGASRKSSRRKSSQRKSSRKKSSRPPPKKRCYNLSLTDAKGRVCIASTGNWRYPHYTDSYRAVLKREGEPDIVGENDELVALQSEYSLGGEIVAPRRTSSKRSSKRLSRKRASSRKKSSRTSRKKSSRGIPERSLPSSDPVAPKIKKVTLPSGEKAVEITDESTGKKVVIPEKIIDTAIVDQQLATYGQLERMPWLTKRNLIIAAAAAGATALGWYQGWFDLPIQVTSDIAGWMWRMLPSFTMGGGNTSTVAGGTVGGREFAGQSQAPSNPFA